MKFLDLIFGKKAAKTARKVQKAVSTQPAKAKGAALPKLVWTKSEKGNDTTEFQGTRITIFKQQGEWNYCIAEILDEDDIAEGVQDEPIFGDGYATKTAAKNAALDEIA
jgi:hypothetical protein